MVNQVSDTTKKPALPVIAGPKGPMLSITYRGKSMYPLFFAGDALLLDTKKPVHPGDVIVYKKPEEETLIIHRAISIRQGMITTAGDNNHSVDPYTIPVSSVFGVVCYQQRADVIRKVREGFWGLAIHVIHPVQKKGMNFLTWLFRPLYLWISRKIAGPIASRIIPVKKKLVLTPFGEKYEYLTWGGFLIGYKNSSSHWYIRPPFRLCIDPGILKEHTDAEADGEGEL